MNWYKQSQEEQMQRPKGPKVYLERGGVAWGERFFTGWGYNRDMRMPKWGPIEQAVDFSKDGFGIEVSQGYAERIADDIEENSGIRPTPYVDDQQEQQEVWDKNTNQYNHPLEADPNDDRGAGDEGWTY